MELIYRSLLTLVADPSLWLIMFAAVPLGMIFGAVPGLGGKLGIVLSIPLVFGMETVPGCVFLVAMHSVVHTGGSIPSILLGIPGTGPDAATVCDGYPMARRGEGGRALGASLAASAVGGVFGAVFLAALMPIVQPTVLAFGPAESFFLALLGITFIGAVSGNDVVKGVLVGALGLMLSFVGAEQQTGLPRFSMGQIFLWDGIDMITAVLAIFAIPECLALAGHRTVVSTVSGVRYGLSELLDGVADVGRHWGLTLRTSFIGAVIGLIPGLGGDVASWMCYAHAVQTSKTPERFGSGAVEGVIGPEAANNSKEGGSLLPTLFFGIPGSSGMAMMLGAFIVLGVQPGPSMALEHLDLVWILIWTLVIANLLGAFMFFIVGRWLALVVHLRGGLLVPFILLLTCLGAYLGGASWENLLLLVALGMFGCGFKQYDWPRAPFVIGIALGPIMERSLHQSLAIWGPGFVFRPVALSLALATLITVVVSLYRARSKGDSGRSSDPLLTAALLAVFAAMVATANGYPRAARLMPMLVGIPAMVLAAYQVWRERAAISLVGIGRATDRRPKDPIEASTLAWLVAFVSIVLLGGFTVGGPIAVIVSQRMWLKESWRTALIGGAASFVLLFVFVDRLMGLVLFNGWIALLSR